MNAEAAFVHERSGSTGAVLIGRRMFDVGFEPWGDPLRFETQYQPTSPAPRIGTDVLLCLRRALRLPSGWVHRRQRKEAMPHGRAPRLKQGSSSYVPSIEKKYGRSIAEWQRIIGACTPEKQMGIVRFLKSEYDMGHGHANALVAWTLARNVARP
jgi:uncharacterized protein DUF4287